jgi:hypothetical protein
MSNIILKTITFEFETNHGKYFGKVEYTKSFSDCYKVNSIINGNIITCDVSCTPSMWDAEIYFRYALIKYMESELQL